MPSTRRPETVVLSAPPADKAKARPARRVRLLALAPLLALAACEPPTPETVWLPYATNFEAAPPAPRADIDSTGVISDRSDRLFVLGELDGFVSARWLDDAWVELEFAADAPDLVTGDVILHAGSPAMLRRIKQVEDLGARLWLETEAASLDDAAVAGAFDVRAALPTQTWTVTSSVLLQRAEAPTRIELESLSLELTPELLLARAFGRGSQAEAAVGAHMAVAATLSATLPSGSFGGSIDLDARALPLRFDTALLPLRGHAVVQPTLHWQVVAHGEVDARASFAADVDAGLGHERDGQRVDGLSSIAWQGEAPVTTGVVGDELVVLFAVEVGVDLQIFDRPTLSTWLAPRLEVVAEPGCDGLIAESQVGVSGGSRVTGSAFDPALVGDAELSFEATRAGGCGDAAPVSQAGDAFWR